MTRLALVSVALFSIGIVAAGCGGGTRGSVSSGPMPEGGSFTGIWNSPQYGEMHLVQTGSAVVGCYVQNERRGRIQGTASGNVLRFEWSERREMVVGRPTMTRGRGYFQYALDSNGDHVFTGQWGADDNETGGGQWNAWRDRRRTRRPSPDCTESTDSGGSGEQQGDSFEGGGSSGSGSGSGTTGGDSGGGDELEGLDL
jgi:hypothetical protein